MVGLHSPGCHQGIIWLTSTWLSPYLCDSLLNCLQYSESGSSFVKWDKWHFLTFSFHMTHCQYVWTASPVHVEYVAHSSCLVCQQSPFWFPLLCIPLPMSRALIPSKHTLCSSLLRDFRRVGLFLLPQEHSIQWGVKHRWRHGKKNNRSWGNPEWEARALFWGKGRVGRLPRTRAIYSWKCKSGFSWATLCSVSSSQSNTNSVFLYNKKQM